jgi:hypothetical protein
MIDPTGEEQAAAYTPGRPPLSTQTDATAPPGGPRPAPPRGLLLLRALAGLLLLGVALAVAFWPRGRQLDVAWRLTSDRPELRGAAAEIDSVRAGESALLRVTVRPGPDAPQGATLVCNSRTRPRLLISAPSGIAFDINRGFAHHAEEEIPMRFSVAASALPGRYQLKLYIETELAVESNAVTRTVTMRTSIPLEVRAAGDRRGDGAR